MFSPVKAITAGALVFALGGVLLIAQPFDQQGASVPGAATDEERAAPVEVTGTAVEGACPGGGTSTMDGPVQKTRGWTCANEMSMSDPRLEGTFSRAWNLDRYVDGTGPSFGYATGRLETDGGSWLQRPRLTAWRGGGDAELLVFDGEDAYEGLLAVLYLVGGEDGVEVDLHGYIVEHEYPPSDHLVE